MSNDKREKIYEHYNKTKKPTKNEHVPKTKDSQKNSQNSGNSKKK